MATQLPFVLLSPITGADVWIPTVDPSEVIDSPTPDHFLWLYRELKESKVVVIDVETKGVRTWVADDYVVGLGVAWAKSNGEIGVRYFAMRTADDFRLAISALNGIPTTAHVMAHNVNFDAAWIDEMADRVGSKRAFEWTHCTYGLMKQLASEGWENQQWGLKWAMVHLLGWPNSNETELDNWLLGQGYHKQGPTKDPLDSPDAHLAKLKQWVSQGKGKNARKVSPDKGEMWRAPTSILGHYCALDCLSTLDLYQRVLRPVLDKFPEFEWYHTTPWLYVNLLLTEQQRHGIRVDRPAMERHLADLNATMEIAERRIREAPVLRDGIAAIEEKRKEESLLELKEREPSKLKKDGTPSKGWLNWQQQVLNPKYKEWSPGSSKDLRELLYDGGIVLVEDAEDERMFILHGLNGPVELERTDSGLMSVDSEVLSQLPKEIADPLSEYLDAKKEASIVTSYLELLHHTEDGGWRLHAGWSVPGTLTGRLGGREPNLQAIPKSIKFLDCFIPDPGFTWIEADCYHPSTDLLTKTGWKPVMEVTKEDEVWQVDKDTLIGSWVRPLAIIHKETDSMIRFGNIRGGLTVTANHTMLWSTQKTRVDRNGRTVSRPYSPKVIPASDGIPKYNTSLMTSSSGWYGSSAHTEWEIWMACMIQADGSHSHNAKGITKNWKIQVSKKRKRDKIRELLGRDGTIRPPRPYQTLPTETWFGIQFTSDLLCFDTKQLRLSSLGPEHAETLVSAISFWDGSIGRSGEISYCSTARRNTEEIQSYLIRCGYEVKLSSAVAFGRKTLYKAVIRKAKNLRLRRGIDERAVEYKGPVGCVQVPTGFLLVRSEGQTFISGNCAALEPHVLAELSRDKALLDLYGPNANPNHDRYLYTVAGIPSPQFDEVRAHYDLSNPTKDGVKAAKTNCKKLRDLGKVLVLSGDYGAGAKAKWRKCLLQGIRISLDEMRDIHAAQLELHSGVADYRQELEREWHRRGGWILSGLGFPTPVHVDYTKDLVNRNVQRTGHDVHVLCVWLLHSMLSNDGVNTTGVVWDFHDQFIYQVAADQSNAAISITEGAITELNRFLGGDVRIKYGPRLVNSLSEAKMEEAFNERAAKG